MSIRQGLFPGLVALAGLAALVVIEAAQRADWTRERRTQTWNAAQMVRTRLEAEITTSLALGQGLAIAIQMGHRPDPAAFDSAARQILSAKRHIRSVALSEGSVVTRIYPLPGNESVLGRDLSRVPEQWPGLERALRGQQAVLTGPHSLIEGGGAAFIARLPVLSSQTDRDGQPLSWGQISLPINPDLLFETAGLTAPDRRIDLAVRTRDGMTGAESGPVFFGDGRLFADDPVLLDIIVPGGTWIMAARPREGWKTGVTSSVMALRTFGGLLILFLTISAWTWSHRRDALREGQRRLAQSESRLSAILNAAPFPLAVLRRADGMVLYANPRATQILGAQRDDLVGQVVPPRLIHPRDRTRLLAQLADRGYVDDIEVRLRALDGRPFVGLVSMAPLHQDGPALLVACNDITARKSAENALHDQLALHQTVIDTIPNTIFYKDVEGRHLGCNRAFMEISGLSRDQIIGRTLKELLTGNALSIQRSEESDRALIRGQSRLVVYETDLTAADGRVVHTLVHKAAIRNAEGRVTGIVGAATDITDRKDFEAQLTRARDEAQSADRSKSEFLAVISHEIRTPLNGILGISHLLAQTPLDQIQQDYARTIQSSGEALLTILNDILDFSRIEAGRAQVADQPFDLTQALNGIIALMSAPAREKGIALTLDMDPDIPRFVSGDVARIRQILLNLLGNAVKFTDAGEAALALFRLPDQQGRVMVRFEVRDTGIGIAADALSRLFHAFTQADSSISRRYGGTGLGLAICKRLVELMGGQIGADSEPGRGSRFWFTLPLTLSDAQSLALPSTIQANRRPLTLLLAEDNPVNRKVAQTMLAQAGHQVTVVEDGAQAVQTMRDQAFDLILMDVHMPRMDGLEATQRIRALGGLGATVPIIALTANVMAGDQDVCRKAGMDDYLAKPFKPHELFEMLAKWTDPA